MAIINIGSSFSYDYSGGSFVKSLRTEYHDGEYCPIGHGSGNDEKSGMTLFESHAGLCLSEREMNGYDDSDWYMLVWDSVAKSAHEICFASTRGWTYPCMGSWVDATPEVVAAYEVWRAAQVRRARVLARWAARKADNALVALLQVSSRADVRKLRAGTGDCFEPIVALLKTRKFRSAYRASLAAQVRTWIADPAPKYTSPLSLKQMQSIAGYASMRY